MAAVIESLVNRILECEEIAEKENRRFIAVKDSETYDIVQSERNANTVRATSSHLRLFKNWLQSEQEFRQPESISQQELDMYLARFFLSIRKTASDSESKSGDRQYEPDTLRCIHSSIHRHLQQNGYKGDIKKGEAFKHSRDVLAAKQKELKKQGKGNKVNASQPFTEEDMNLFWEKNLLGTSNPDAIINSMWLYMTMQFGLRGRHEHKQMSWGDVELMQDSSGTEYLEFTERVSKTRQGSTRTTRAFRPKIFATGTTRCPVNVYKEYERHRPEDCRSADSRFYLRPVREPPTEQWFTRQALGKNTSMLLHDNVPPTEVMQISGHRNIQSLNSYSSLSIKQQQCLSNKLSARIANEPTAADNGLSIRHTSCSSLSTASSSASSVGVTTSVDDLLQLPPEIETQLFDDFEMPMEFDFRSTVPSVSHLPASRPVSHLPDSASVSHLSSSATFSHLPASAPVLYLQGASVHGNIIININQPGQSF